MRGPLFLGFALMTLVFAGCIDAAHDVPEPNDGTDVFLYEDDRFKIQGINDTAKDWVPTLAEAPQLALGEYWKIRLTEGFEGETYEAYIVVAGQEDDHWLVGMPTHDFSNDLMVLHVPGLGQVKKDTLGFEAHDVWMDPIQFPVAEGDTWTTGFMQAENQQAEVTKVDGLTATIEMTGTYQITMVYDAEIRGFRSFEAAGYASWEVVEHGFDWHVAAPELEGTVTVPHMSDLILCHGRFATALDINAEACALGQPNIPMESVDIDTTYDRVSASLILIADGLGALGPAATPVFIDVTATAPDGEAYHESLTAADGVPVKITSLKHDKPGGSWDVQAIVTGPALGFIEGIGYHVYDVVLPSGRILPSIGEHQHGSGEGH